MRVASGKSFGASVLLFLLSAIAGIAVSLFLVVSLDPLVELFPPSSGARQVAYGIALMWGLVVAATVAVFAFGSFRRLEQKHDFYDPRWQQRYVPAAPAAGFMPQDTAPLQYREPAYSAPAPAPAPVIARRESAAELEQRLRQMEALMAANCALVERLEHAAAPRLARLPLPAAPPRVYPPQAPVAAPAQRMRAYR